MAISLVLPLRLVLVIATAIDWMERANFPIRLHAISRKGRTDLRSSSIQVRFRGGMIPGEK